MFLLTPLLVFALLGSTPAAAAEQAVIPEGCVDKSYCDGTRCYAPESAISEFACACGLINPVCGVGKCSEGSYCEGSGCGDSAVCHPPSSPVSQVMCGGAKMGAACEPPAGGCGVGACVGGEWCDSCGCQHVTPGPNNSCSEGGWDTANCHIMSAPSGTTAFKWGNGFYYAE